MTTIYSKIMQRIAVLIGLLVAIVFNFDIIQLVDRLWQISTIKELADIAQKTGQKLDVDISVLMGPFPLGSMPEDPRQTNYLIRFLGLLGGGMSIAYASQFVYRLLRKQLRSDE
jgi:hypothetical protein